MTDFHVIQYWPDGEPDCVWTGRSYERATKIAEHFNSSEGAALGVIERVIIACGDSIIDEWPSVYPLKLKCADLERIDREAREAIERAAREAIENKARGQPRSLSAAAATGGANALVVAELRRQLLDAGFAPLPIAGKRPVIEAWQKQTTTTTEDIERWRSHHPTATNTGVLTARAPALDIDILQPAAADAVETLVRERFGSRGRLVVRFGRQPKRCIPFRSDAPFSKILASLVPPGGGDDEKIEFLANGQQFVVAGIHPDTKQPYHWLGGELGEIKRTDLPAISEAEAKALVNDICALLVGKYGYTAKGAKPKAGNGATGGPTPEPEKIEAALAVVPSDDYQVWFEVAAALHKALGEAGRALFHRWSAKSSKYDAAACDKKWEEVADVNGYNAGTIFHHADQADHNWRARYENKQGKAEGRTKEKQGEPKKEIIIVRATDVRVRAKDWIWPGHLLRGAQELLTGAPGLGKSQVQISFVACATAGLPWPDGTPAITPVNVLMITAEDTLDQEVVPRLLAAGADPHRVFILKRIKTDAKERQFLLAEDLEQLEVDVARIGNVGLVTIDPITAYMGGKIDSHKATEVRSQLGPLKDFAERTNVAMSTITHPAKNAGKRSIDHFIGSQAFIAACRIGHICVEESVKDEDGDLSTGRILFANVKNNAHKKMPTLAYRVSAIVIDRDEKTGENIEAPRVVWDAEPVNVTADEAVAGPRRRRDAHREAEEFLGGLLKDGPVKTTVIEEKARLRGFSEKHLRTAKEKLGVLSEKEKFSGGWLWRLPDPEFEEVI